MRMDDRRINLRVRRSISRARDLRQQVAARHHVRRERHGTCSSTLRQSPQVIVEIPVTGRVSNDSVARSLASQRTTVPFSCLSRARPYCRTLPTVTTQEVALHLESSRAQSTNKDRASVLRRYCAFCLEQGHTPYPASADALVEYTVSLTKCALMYETVYKYVNTVRTESRLFETTSLSVADEELVRLTLQSAKRILRNRKQKRTVTLTLEQVKQVMLLNPPSGRTVSVVAFLTGIFCLLRLKEVVSLSPTDITQSACGAYLKVHIRSSKTDQSGSGQTVILGCSHGKPYCEPCEDGICAMHRVAEVLDKGPNEASKPTLFGLSYSQLSKDINALVENVFKDTDPEIEVGRKTSHSMRRTGVCLLADAKVPLHEIAEYGRWKDTSTVENVYLRDQSQRAKRERHFSERMIGCVESSTILVPRAIRSERSPSSSSSAVDVDFAWGKK